MKRVTASEARQNWFRLLDEVLAGEVVVVERQGRRIVVREEEAATGRGPEPAASDYASVLRGDVDRADVWNWDWPGADDEVEPASTDAPHG
jgi:antitoxin (DNA-binding transcriptional repressor) of toxin-antitoxin stability system